MRTRQELDQLRDQARSLRVAGKSRREIKQLLDVEDNKLLSKWLEGLPPPEWTKRPNAKDDLREQARDLRRQGLNYKDIAARLHVSTAGSKDGHQRSCSLRELVLRIMFAAGPRDPVSLL